MKKALLLAFTISLVTLSFQTSLAQCNAAFTWEQIPGTLQIHFHSTSTSEHDIISFQWNFGDGHEGDGSNPYHTYTEPGTYLVCLIIEDNEGCISDVCHEVQVEGVSSDCEASFTWEQIPGTFQIHFHSTSTSDHDIVSYNWNFGDGHEGDGSNPYHTYDEPGTYLVCLIIEDEVGCVSDVCHEVEVEGIQSECHAGFEWEQFQGTLEVDFTNTSTSQHDIISYLWNFGDGHMGDGANPSHTYDEPGTYLVCLIIENEAGCVSDVCHEVTVEGVSSECNAAFTWEQVGGTLSIQFNSTSTSNHDIVSYHWTFGDGHEGDGPHPLHTYDEPGTYLVCLIIEDAAGCVSDVCHEVTVGSPEGCHADFEWTQFENTLEIHFESTSTSNHDIISYQWNFGDGHTGDGQNPNHTYAHPGTYLVCLRIEDNAGCVSEICHEVTVMGEGEGCHADFEWSQFENSLEIHFESTSTSNHDIISYQWNFGDGHTGDGQNPNHNYAHPGTYLVCLRIEDNAGCVSEICHEVTVMGEGEGCHAAFTWEQIGGTLNIQFNSTSTSNHDIISYHWIFGDGHEGDGPHPAHTYEEPGTYLVCLIIHDAAGCVSDVCHEVTVGEPEEECNASFNYEENEEGVIFFNNTSTGGTSNTTWLWDFGDGHTSTEENPQHEYAEPGLYTVCLFMTDTTINCEDHYCHTLAFNMAWEDLHNDAMAPNSQMVLDASTHFEHTFRIPRYTNPASTEIRIDYFLETASAVNFELFDLTGYRWITTRTEVNAKGRHDETLDISQIPHGLYILTYTAGGQRIAMGVNILR